MKQKIIKIILNLKYKFCYEHKCCIQRLFSLKAGNFLRFVNESEIFCVVSRNSKHEREKRYIYQQLFISAKIMSDVNRTYQQVKT